MAGENPKRDPVELLAEEFIQRYRRGESPTLSEYTERHPDLADEIRDLFPVIAALEGLKIRREQSTQEGDLGGVRLERLGDFRIIREIGRGGMGIVYEAEQESLKRHVAVKVLPRQTLLDSRILQRFEREARTAARLHHTNIVPVFGVGRQDDYHYYVMQFIRGVGLDEVISQLREVGPKAGMGTPGTPVEDVGSATGREVQAVSVARALLAGEFRRSQRPSSSTHQRPTSDASGSKPGTSSLTPEHQLADTPTIRLTGGSSPGRGNSPEDIPEPAAFPAGDTTLSEIGGRYWRSVATIGLQVAEALAYAHGQGTLHRDIKPGNLLLDAQGVVWVTDFGLAKALEQDNVTLTGDLVGTLRYMAPEQFSGQSDARSDIYSLGLTLYEMLALRPAYEDAERTRLIRKITEGEHSPLRRQNAHIPRDLETIVLKAIAREPTHRYATADELAGDLQSFLEDRPIKARRVGPLERLWRWSRRNPATAGLGSTALVSMVLVAIVATVGYVRTRSANLRVQESLARETLQRQKAEATAELMSDALDTIFNRFAPRRGFETSDLGVSSNEDTTIDVPFQPVLSNDTASLLEKMLEYYDRLSQQSGETVGLRQKTARAHRRIGDIQQRLGNSDQALNAYLKAVELFQRLEHDVPTSEEYPLEIARIQDELAGLYWASSRPEEGFAALAKARAILEPKAKAPSAPAPYRYELAKSYYLLSGHRSRGIPPFGHLRSGPPAEHHARAGPPAPPGEPDPPPPPPPSPTTRSGQGGLGRRSWGYRPPTTTGSPQDHHALLAQAIQILDGLVKEHPTVPDYRHLLALCHRETVMGRRGPDWQASLNGLDKATQILQELVNTFPDVAEYRYDLATTYAMAARPFGHLDAASRKTAEQRLLSALAIMDKLVAEHPNIPDYQMARVRMFHGLARLQQDGSDPEAAEKTLRKALTLQTSLAERFPRVAIYKVWLAAFQGSLADILRDRGLLKESRTLLENANSLLTRLLSDKDEAFPLHGLLADNYTRLAEVLRRSGQAAPAARAEEQARTFRDLMPHRSPGAPKDPRDLIRRWKGWATSSPATAPTPAGKALAP